jgi:hypothetical protein
MSTQLEEIFNRWSKIRIDDSEVKKLIELAMFPKKEIMSPITEEEYKISKYYENVCKGTYEYLHASDTQQMDTTKGTLFGAYNAITGYFQNVKEYKDGEAKLKSIMFGGLSQTRTQNAFNICNEFASN